MPKYEQNMVSLRLIGIMHYRTLFFYHLISVKCDNYKTEQSMNKHYKTH